MARLHFYLAILAVLSVADGDTKNCTGQHSRHRRMVFMNSQRQLTLPPSTEMHILPTLKIPFGRNLPLGYSAEMILTFPVNISFDLLGLTSEENPFGIFPDFFRRKREAGLPSINWAGGDREMMYQMVEDSLHNLGLDGEACLLRAVCEIFQAPLMNHGFVGEVLELFFSASQAPYAEKRLREYLAAERNGRSTGDCSAYHLMCPHSLFTRPQSLKNTEEFTDHHAEKKDRDKARVSLDSGWKREDKTTDSHKKITLKKQRKRCTQRYI